MRTECPHAWVPLSAALEECLTCGAQRAPVFRYVHQQSGEIITTTVTGEPVAWVPIDEEEIGRASCRERV